MVEIDIEENSNVRDSEIRNFMSMGVPIPINHFSYYDEQSKDFYLVDVVAWNNDIVSQAYLLQVEDSGDGQAYLIYGGNHGVRLRHKLSLPKDFSLENNDEWGELYLYYHFSLFEKHIMPFI